MEDITVIDEPAAAEISLDPVRARLLAELAQQSSSASGLSRRLGIPRQKINYHLRALERHELVELVEERRKGNCVERIVRATAETYVISPKALGDIRPDPDSAPDRLSAGWLLALASRMLTEVGDLIRGAKAAGKPAATFGLESRVRFASPRDRAEFAEKLTRAISALIAEYHDESAPLGRDHRVVIGLHPITPSQTPAAEEDEGAPRS